MRIVKTPKIILVCGGRDFIDFNYLYDVLKEWNPKCIVHGDCKGADKLSGIWAKNNGIPTIVVEPNWTYYGKRAGMLRNEWMIKYINVDMVIAFKGGKGTTGMCNLANKHNIPVRRY